MAQARPQIFWEENAYKKLSLLLSPHLHFPWPWPAQQRSLSPARSPDEILLNFPLIYLDFAIQQ